MTYNMVTIELSPTGKLSEYTGGRHEASFTEGNFESINDVNLAVDILSQGGVVAGQWHQIYGLWVDARNPYAIIRAQNAKGEIGVRKPMSSMILSEYFLEIVDTDAIHPLAKELFIPKKGKKIVPLQARAGSLYHVRAPIKESALISHNVPDSLLSVGEDNISVMQNLDTFGDGPMRRFIKMSRDRGINMMGVTSMNNAGEREITGLAQAEQFCKEQGVRIMLRDNHTRPQDIKGSFAIVDLTGPSVVRDGHIPADIASKILGIEVNDFGMKGAKYERPNLPDLDQYGVLPPEIYAAIIKLHLKGFSDDQIRERIAGYKDSIGKVRSRDLSQAAD